MTKDEAQEIIENAEWAIKNSEYTDYSDSIKNMLLNGLNERLEDIQEQIEESYDKGYYDSDDVCELIACHNNLEEFKESI